MLLGRAAECRRLDEALATVRKGDSTVLVMRGDPGVGKSALLDYLSTAAAGLRIVRVAGVESEMELPYAALHQLCLPLLDRVDRLPEPQAEAVATTFGLRTGPPPTPFLVGLGVLNLLAEAAQDAPVLCVVDDAQWLDAASAQVLMFVARRLQAEAVLMVFATRHDLPGMRDLPLLPVAGLPDDDARRLLSSVVRWPLDDSVRHAILAEAAGNPLALLELPLGRAPAALAGGYGLLDVLPLSGRIEESFRRRIDELPAEDQALLLVVAADPVGDASAIWRAAAALGIDREAGGTAVRAGLLRIGVRMTFRHPLVRSAVYGAAPPAERRRAHRALAEVTSPESDPDRRAWHLAQATAAEDETVAEELEASASRAQARGGLAAAAAFLERAASLTTDEQRRADRALAAAQAKYDAGSLVDARVLVDRAANGRPDALRDAHITHLRGHLAFASGDSADAPALLLSAARQFERLDPGRARETYLDALTYALLAGRFAQKADVAAVAAAARAAPSAAPSGAAVAPSAAPVAPSAASPLRAADLLLDGLAALHTDGHAAGVPPVRRALDAFRRPDLPPAEALRWLSIACHGSYEVWDDDAWTALAEAHVRLARLNGALVMLPVALNQRVNAHLHAGEFGAAAALAAESDAVGEATGIARPRYSAAAVAAWRGAEDVATALIADAMETVVRRREGIGLTLIQYTNAVLHNGLGRWPQAVAAAELATAHPGESAFAAWALAELVEAAARAGEPEKAERAYERLVLTTRPSATDWSLGVEARCRALITTTAAAEAHFREAIDRLGRSRGAMPLARAHQVYGEWLRQRDRRTEARAELRKAHEMFAAVGAQAFAERAGRELLAGGEAAVPDRSRPAVDALTPQEQQIARLARDGRTNTEIGGELFLSARTVEWHLRKVFNKLGIANRRELARVLPDPRPGRIRAA
ncbi:helix-turn-helix transcriptional regulator [Paractinoplanes deccanensis]|uniref:Helix-turn-helix transcriptional regulator n=1 Tax=Paractinoplanes deccanensis TaxID=113561 RepID=A0ABQ3Y371_9ACTN|nr:helix-turn-helix transcriptional regulator [Actinoplanes deccanensis]GID74451.1 helix-turn-helix transcriptional regulator [Actinoplanes deccanensis]